MIFGRGLSFFLSDRPRHCINCSLSSTARNRAFSCSVVRLARLEECEVHDGESIFPDALPCRCLLFASNYTFYYPAYSQNDLQQEPQLLTHCACRVSLAGAPRSGGRGLQSRPHAQQTAVFIMVFLEGFTGQSSVSVCSYSWH